MKSLVLLLVLAFFQLAPSSVKKEQEHPKKETTPTQEAPKPTAQPTSQVTTPVSQPSPNTQTNDAKDKPSGWPPWTDIFWPTWLLVIVTAIAVYAALKTLGSINAQVTEMQETGRQTDRLIAENIAQSQFLRQQAESLAKSAYHLGESAAGTNRSAKAMEEVAEKIAVSTQAATASVSAINKQVRAYLFVLVGSGTFQDRASNLKFAASPTLVNAGNTPAYKVAYKAKAAILPIPLPDDFTFPLPEEPIGGSPLGPHQNATLNAITDAFCPDEEVESIKVGAKDKVLYVWGIVTYQDVFGDSHSTKFCHSVNFLKVGEEYRITGFYIGRHEEAD